MKEVFKKEHIGMTVYHVIHGKGKIVDFQSDEKYPLKIKFSEEYECFLPDGREFMHNRNPSLSFKEYHLPVGWDKPPLPDLPIDTPILVWDAISAKKIRYFAGFTDDGKVLAFKDGVSSNYTSIKIEWDNWELACKENIDR